MKKFAVFDIDGTLIRWQLYHAVADSLAKLGYIAPGSYQKVKDARMLWKKRTHAEAFKTYEAQLVIEFDRIITGLKVSSFSQAVDSVFNEYKDQVYSYTRDLIEQLKKRDYLLFAISGSQIEVVGKIAKYYGFDDCVGSRYVHRGGHFTGEKVLTLGSKAKILRELVKKHKATFAGSIAVGDSEGDIDMLEAVEQPIVFNPAKQLFDYAKRSNWPIVIERKNVIYKLNAEDGRYLLA